MMKLYRASITILIFGVMMATLTGCGGGPESVSVASFAGLEGYAEHVLFMSVYGYGGYPGFVETDLAAGLYYNASLESYHNYKILLSFSLNGLAGAKVQSAWLRLYLGTITGTPFDGSTLGPLLINAVQYNPSTPGQNLYNDIDTMVDAPSWVLTQATADTWYEVDVTRTVQDAIELGRQYAQFRLEHQHELFTGTASQQTRWAMSGDASHPPALEITFTR